MPTSAVTVHERSESYDAPGIPGTRELPSAGGLPHLSEEQLSELWEGQRFPASALVTTRGVPLRVLHPGRAGRGGGPDFRDAIIASPSGRALRGDVELHVRAADFRAHGHQRDHAYDRVVLHVVFDAGIENQTVLANGRHVPIVALAGWLRERARQIETWLSAPKLWREPCHDAVARLGPETVAQQLDCWGGERFRARSVVVANEVRRVGPAVALFSALVEGLGYGGNRGLMDQLASLVSWQDVASLVHADNAPAGRLQQLLVARATGFQGVHAGRPANNPARRLEGLGLLVARHRLLFASPPEAAVIANASTRELVAAFSAPPLIGRSRAIELLTNAVLPWAAALGDPALAERALRHFAALPVPARYGALGFLERNLETGGKRLSLNTRRQQGLLALYKSECTQGGCGRCALSR